VVFAANALRPQPEGSITSFGDVHGLAVDPEDPSRVFVATHHGLIVGKNDGNWTRVGPVDDLMGFSAHPSDASMLWVTGHPRERTIDRHNLGVRKCLAYLANGEHVADGGATWRMIKPPA